MVVTVKILRLRGVRIWREEGERLVCCKREVILLMVVVLVVVGGRGGWINGPRGNSDL